MTKSKAIYEATLSLSAFRRHATTDGRRVHVMAADGVCRHPRYVFTTNASGRWMGAVCDQATTAYLDLPWLDTGVKAGCRNPEAIAAGIRRAVEQFEAADGAAR